MLKLKKLTIQDFGPFKDEQSISLPDENGTTVVYGENMRGKTLLLNAIRYALFGKVLARGAREVHLHQLVNWEKAEEGKYGFKVVLSFTYEGHDYELTRSFTPRNSGTVPKTDEDYTQETFLRRDGSVLSPGEKDSVLAKIMPEQVSRFFLFDGELLQEYEELLREETWMGEKIKLAIERILGVPILTNARTDLFEGLKLAQKEESKVAQKDQKTKVIGNHLQERTEQRAHQDEELQRLKEELDKLKETRRSLEEILKKWERVKTLMDERTQREGEISNLTAQMEDKSKRMKDVATTSWKSILESKIKDAATTIREEANALRERMIEKSSVEQMINILEKGVLEGSCSICEQSIDDKTLKIIKKRISELQTKKWTEEDQKKLDKAFQTAGILERFKGQDVSAVLKEISNDIDRMKVREATARMRVEEINEALKDYNQKEVQEAFAGHEKAIKDIALLEDGIGKQEGVLAEIDKNIHDLQDALKNAGNIDLAKAQEKREMYEKLHDLMKDAIGVYRERLRKKVEKDATDLFLKLTSEPDYGALVINENYGLTIVHKDGKPISVRSAGAEHIVALSLMGALQKNAPLRGPLIMDSPFGRLDEAHTQNVVKTLPSMSDQTVLLVYKSELEPQMARNILKGKLKAEYKMVRKSARYTVLEKSRGDE